MTGALHLDTHVTVWLYAGEHDRLPITLRERLDSDPLRVSPMVGLELTYLHEIGRLTEPSQRILAELERALGLRVDNAPFSEITVTAERLSWTRDPFDRLIIAQAITAGCALATKDSRIREHLPELAVWA